MLATLASPATSFATDGTSVYLTHVDGSIGAVAVGGGTEKVLVSGEAGPTSLLVDDTQMYWLAADTGAVYAAAKDGSAQVTLIEADGRKRGQIIVAGDRILARDHLNLSAGSRNTFTAVSKDGSEKETYEGDFGLNTRASWDAVAGRVDIIVRGGDRSRGDDDAAVQSFSTTPRAFDGWRVPDIVTLDQHHVTGIASGGDGYVYWTTNEASGGALRRIRR